jgi:hypothetical protein
VIAWVCLTVVTAWVCLTVVVFVDLAWMKAAAVVDELSFVPDYYRPNICRHQFDLILQCLVSQCSNNRNPLSFVREI